MSNLYRAEAAAALQQLEVVRSRLEMMLRAAHDHIDQLSRENAHLREENARLRRTSRSGAPADGHHPSGEYPVRFDEDDDPSRRMG
jgi:hypothetical protein